MGSASCFPAVRTSGASSARLDGESSRTSARSDREKARGGREDVALAGARPLFGDGRLDEPARFAVVSAQHGDEGPGPGAGGPRALVLPERRREGVEDRVRVVETALKNADERDVRGEGRRIRPERAAGLDDGLGRCGGMADAHQAAGEGAVPPGLRQRTEQAGGAGLGQEPPILRCERGAVDPVESAGDGVAAKLHREPGFVPVVREPRLHAAVAGHDRVEHPAAVRLHGQPRRPARRRPQTATLPGGVREPRIDELPVGVLDPRVRQGSSVGVDAGMAQYRHDLRHGAHVRVHHPVDERRRLSVGRQGGEEACEGLRLRRGHGSASISPRCAGHRRLLCPPESETDLAERARPRHRSRTARTACGPAHRPLLPHLQHGSVACFNCPPVTVVTVYEWNDR